MSTLEITEQPLPAVTLSELTARANDQSEINALVEPMFDELLTKAAAAGMDIEAPSYAWYDDTEDGLNVGVGMPIAENAEPLPGTQRGFLPACERALTVVHRGDMKSIADTWQALDRAVEERGLTFAGRCRERYIDTRSDDESQWVTELQQPVA